MLIYLLIIILTSLGEAFLPTFIYIPLGCFTAYRLGRWEKEIGL